MHGNDTYKLFGMKSIKWKNNVYVIFKKKPFALICCLSWLDF